MDLGAEVVRSKLGRRESVRSLQEKIGRKAQGCRTDERTDPPEALARTKRRMTGEAVEEGADYPFELVVVAGRDCRPDSEVAEPEET